MIVRMNETDLRTAQGTPCWSPLLTLVVGLIAVGARAQALLPPEGRSLRSPADKHSEPVGRLAPVIPGFTEMGVQEGAGDFSDTGADNCNDATVIPVTIGPLGILRRSR